MVNLLQFDRSALGDWCEQHGEKADGHDLKLLVLQAGGIGEGGRFVGPGVNSPSGDLYDRLPIPAGRAADVVPIRDATRLCEGRAEKACPSPPARVNRARDNCRAVTAGDEELELMNSTSVFRRELGTN